MQTMADRDGVIWFDGKMVDWRDAKIHVLTHTLHYGMGVFEGLRAYKAEKGTAIFRLDAHTDRLFESAKIMNMTIPFDKDTLNQAQLAAVRDNNLESAYVRPMCFYGSEGMGLRADNLKVHVMVAAWEWGAYLGQEALQNGIRIRKSTFVKNDSHPSMYLAKANGNYINSMLALDEALNKGYDEALLLDSKGNVAEGSGENIFMVKDGVLYTPTLVASLNGITRNTIITLAKEQGYEVVETTMKIEQLYDADEVFFTGSAAEVTPIREIDDNTIGNGSRGPVTEKLQTMYFDLVHGRLDIHPDWLNYV
ncbi:MAG: branched-chain amino acid transaminase [Gammaproteobacteria bacterium]|nr:branched-chain amino acid transaminase [Gammaproteobacteria bacterium]MBT8135309.1 branched-chain amino acid transaminase [Gammaproteobacteria bacterium]NNJ49131.1 branched-chain amino acid transaminase [Gammaproteobacteria bacterium]